MEKSFIYARYSSTGQNEQSIEGQVRICKEFAENKGFNVVKVYIDKAKTGTNDNRPDFQRMIEDAKKGNVKYIIVYMFDRFARNRVDSIMYKEMLRSYGVRVVSALEPVSEDEGGEFYEMYLEWNAEKFSKRLSKRVKDGLDTSVENGTFCGGRLIYGYKVHKEPIAGKNERYIKTVAIDEEQAWIVKYVFTEYANGVSKEKIAIALNGMGYRYNGKPFLGKHFDKWLVSPKYTGEFTFGGRECNNMYPAIISKETFKRAQELLKKNKYFAKSDAPRIPYFLTGKLYCGHCGTPMIADSGVGNKGAVNYQYYVCKAMRNRQCNKKREDKDGLELTVTRMTVEYLRDKERVKQIADDMIAYHNSKTDTGILRSLEVRIANTQKDMEDTTTAYIQAVATKNSLFEAGCQKRMNELAVLLDDLQEQHLRLEIEKGDCPTYPKILAFIEEYIEGDITDKAFQKRVIDNLVNAVYVYDSQTVVYFRFENIEAPFISKAETDEAIRKEPVLKSSGSVAIGRGDAIRTRNLRFWRPLLYR